MSEADWSVFETNKRLYTGREFQDAARGNYIVLAAALVDPAKLHPATSDTCDAHEVSGQCNLPIAWYVMDYEGVTYPLCENASTDSEFFSELDEVDAGLAGMFKLARWKQEPDSTPLPVR